MRSRSLEGAGCRRGTACAEAGSLPKATFKLPLRPIRTPADIEDSQKAAVAVFQAEFATRYCERLGVKPTKANQQLLLQTLPLQSSSLQIKLQVTGHNHDEVEITPPTLKHNVRNIIPPLVGPEDVLGIGLENEATAKHSQKSPQQQQEHGRGNNLQATGDGAGNDEPSVSATFQDACTRFLYPFNLRKGLASKAYGVDTGKHAAAPPSPIAPPSSAAQLPASPCADLASPLQPRGSAPRSTASRRRLLGAAPSKKVHTFKMTFKYEGPTAAQQELARPLQITHHLVYDLQAAFADSVHQWHAELLADGELACSITPAQLQAATAQMVGKDMLCLCASMLRLLYHSFIVPLQPGPLSSPLLGPPARHLYGSSHPDSMPTSIPTSFAGGRSSPTIYGGIRSPGMEPPASLALEDTSSGLLSEMDTQGGLEGDGLGLHAGNPEAWLCAIHQRWASMCRHYRHVSGGAAVILPLLLLSMRRLVEACMGQCYPLWAASPDGVVGMHKMDETLCHWVDPHGYYSTLSMLQSAPEAVRLMLNNQRWAHGPERQHHNGISPLLQAALTQPHAVATRRLLHRTPRVQQQAVSTSSRSQLFVSAKHQLAPHQTATGIQTY